MAKHRFQRTRRMQVTRLLLLAVLVLGWGVSPSGAGQQSLQSSPPNAKTAQAAGQSRARTKYVKSAKTSAQRKGTTATSSRSTMAAGRRDPFKLPETGGGGGRGGVENAGAIPEGTVLPGGERGLLISQLTLQGTVREQSANQMIAVVTNETKRAYFLRENQSVYNGVVSKITPDAVYFKENVLDADGRVTTREVVKRLNPAPGEGR
jgi:hypothetical protein